MTWPTETFTNETLISELFDRDLMKIRTRVHLLKDLLEEEVLRLSTILDEGNPSPEVAEATKKALEAA
ncbi:MAG: hypothetical protein JSS20_16310, partial [Proteobacteria bacterium]|nr:hypothetical protein [Pseudomonadota bacterium]